MHEDKMRGSLLALRRPRIIQVQLQRVIQFGHFTLDASHQPLIARPLRAFHKGLPSRRWKTLTSSIEIHG